MEGINPTQAGRDPAAVAERVRNALPAEGLFAGHAWRIAPQPLALGPKLANELTTLGRVLHQFYRAVNLLYRKSAEGKLPGWVAHWLDLGKPADLIALQRSPAFKNDIPRVIRPDILLTDDGFAITELDSVPGGIGLTAWLNQTYSQPALYAAQPGIIGGPEGMLRGFASIFGDASRVHLVVSEEAATYRPEMQWLAGQLGPRFQVENAHFSEAATGEAVYRFFELFDLENVPGAQRIFELAAERRIRLTPPPKPVFEEKMLFALLWNRNLQSFWRQELGENFLKRLQRHVPMSWVMDPTPLPPHAAIPDLGLTDWQQLKTLSHRERELIVKVSGFSAHAWGARGVFLGSDLSLEHWTVAVDNALRHFAESPHVLQRFHKPALVETSWFDFDRRTVMPMKGRARLCPYYFVSGDGDTARPILGGVLATICPADKKIIHGMSEAVMCPCAP